MSAPDRKAEAKRLSVLLWDLNISNKEAIAACGCNPRTLFRWLAGESPIPKPVLTMFELMLEKQQTALADKPESE